MELFEAFSGSYGVARERFRKAASALGWDLESLSIAPRGPDGENLAMDVAISSRKSNQPTLVLSSGIHGVEGFFGSAVQLGLMNKWLQASGTRVPVRLVLLHALNPFGFAWLRRCDENNVDLNRNFLLPHQDFSGSPAGYARLDSLLNPKSPPPKRELFGLKALTAIARHGMPALRQTVAAGQYDFPQGLFFGGFGPSHANQWLGQHFSRWLNGSPDVIHLDFHTGLGRWANYKLLIDYPLPDNLRSRLVRWFGNEAIEDCNAKGISYEATGGLGAWCAARNLAANYSFAYAEFGTYSPLKILSSLRSENRAHHWGDPASKETRLAKKQLCEMFCPYSADWRQRVLASSFELVERVVGGLVSDQ